MQSNLLIANNLDAYINNVKKIPFLQSNEEFILANRYINNNDLVAAERLILSHLRFVVKIAKKYVGYGLPLEDIIQEGNIGLMKAVQRFNPDRGIKLVSFAIHWIKAQINEYVIKNWKIVKVVSTKNQRKLFYNLRKLKSDTNIPSEKERCYISKTLNVSMNEVHEMEQRMYAVFPSFDTINDDGNVEKDNMPLNPSEVLYNEEDNPAVLFEHNEYQEKVMDMIMEYLETLPDREKDIVLSRNFSDTPLTLVELGDRYDVSYERIRQIEKNTLVKLKDKIKEFNQ